MVHLVGQSTGVTSRTTLTKRRPAYWFQSRRRYFIKHTGVAYAVLADAALASSTTLAACAIACSAEGVGHPISSCKTYGARVPCSILRSARTKAAVDTARELSA